MEKVPQIKVKNQMVVGKKTYVDQVTGEVQEFTVVEKNISSDYNFHKIWLQDILHVLDSFGNKKIRILTFLLSEMRNEDNSISVTYEYVSESTGISYPTVAKTMKELLIAGVIRRVRTGLFTFNPDLIVKGDTGKRQRLLIEYNFEDNKKLTMRHEEEVKKIEAIAEKLSDEHPNQGKLFEGEIIE